MAAMAADPGACLYDLYAVVCHRGSFQVGDGAAQAATHQRMQQWVHYTASLWPVPGLRSVTAAQALPAAVALSACF